jgi:Amt family ammonium transporter
MRPHNLTLVMLGAALLWFGWFGFNAGSALTAGTTAAIAWREHAGRHRGRVLWLAGGGAGPGRAPDLPGRRLRHRRGPGRHHPRPRRGQPAGAQSRSAPSPGASCAFAVGLKSRFGYDDSLDVVGVHLVGGLVGTLLIGLFASASAPAAVDGLLYGGGADQLWRQLVGAVVVLLVSFVATYVIGFVLHKLMGFRIERDHELEGIDIVLHAESAYELHGPGGLRTGAAPGGFGGGDLASALRPYPADAHPRTDSRPSDPPSESECSRSGGAKIAEEADA